VPTKVARQPKPVPPFHSEVTRQGAASSQHQQFTAAAHRRHDAQTPMSDGEKWNIS